MKQIHSIFSLLLFLLLFSACLENNQQGTDIRNEIDSDTVDTTIPSESKDPEETNLNTKSIEGFGADYENQNRVIWQKPEMVLEMMGDLTNKTVADIGAGTGHFALRLAKKAKKVIAIDIDKKFTDYIDSIKVMELPDQFHNRLVTRLSSENDPNLKENELDVAVIVNTYMYVGGRTDWMKKVLKGLKPGGKVIIIDFKRKRTPVGPPAQYRVPLYLAEEEMENAGLINVQTNDSALDYQYILIGEKGR
jgi:ubiquinone/menaquinone biosynthesis C-methylase UbiE